MGLTTVKSGLKKIAIIGGGISGLALLHHLHKIFKNTVELTLDEAKPCLGGSIKTLYQDGFLFETGPNGFIDSSAETLVLTDELGLTNDIVRANEKAKRRYIQLNGKLQLLPLSLGGFINTPILKTSEKLKLMAGIFQKNITKDQSVDDYVSKRFGAGVARRMIDPFLRGIYGGDIKRLHMGYAFPRMKKGTMTSFSKGMGQMIDALAKRYEKHIKTSSTILSLDKIDADVILSTIPAYELAGLIGKPVLNELRYCTVSVIGLGFSIDAFKKEPDGFGYLIPSAENTDVLGVLIESNVYPGRAPANCVMLRVMLGIAGDETALKEKAMEELNRTFGLNAKPLVSWVQVWQKAIPQYEMNYPDILAAMPHHNGRLKISGNFIGGISFNDCIANAKTMAESLKASEA